SGCVGRTRLEERRRAACIEARRAVVSQMFRNVPFTPNELIQVASVGSLRHFPSTAALRLKLGTQPAVAWLWPGRRSVPSTPKRQVFKSFPARAKNRRNSRSCARQ